jgi:hypothetical protein
MWVIQDVPENVTRMFLMAEDKLTNVTTAGNRSIHRQLLEDCS